MRRAGLALALVLAAPAVAAEPVALPGISYEVLRSGPATGPHPTRADTVAIIYTGRLANGAVFSTSAANGTEPSDFAVQRVIPGFMAAIQLMRPGDQWRITIPSYLAYGAPGRRYLPPEATLKRDIPPNSTLVFDVGLVAIKPTVN